MYEIILSSKGRILDRWILPDAKWAVETLRNSYEDVTGERRPSCTFADEFGRPRTYVKYVCVEMPIEWHVREI